MGHLKRLKKIKLEDIYLLYLIYRKLYRIQIANSLKFQQRKNHPFEGFKQRKSL